MTPFNPYQAPLADGEHAPPAEGHWDEEEVPPRILDLFRQARPWVIFLAIVGFASSGLMIIAGLWFMTASAQTKLTGYLGIGYAVLGALYLLPSLLLFQYGSSIGRLVRSGDMYGLADAVGQQKSFWKLVGVLTLVLIGGYALVLLGAAVIGVTTHH